VVVPAWVWAAARSRGVSHERAGTRIQDAAVSFAAHAHQFFVAIVCDGAGSASFGGQGASLVARTFSKALRQYLAQYATFPSVDLVQEWTDRARDRIGAVSQRRGLAPRDFAATLLLVMSTGNSSMLVHVGDGCAVLKEQAGGRWIAPIWPFHGEYASTTAFVTDDVGAQLRTAVYEAPISALAVFSDGVERLALDFQAREPFQPFFESMIEPLMTIDGGGRSAVLSEELRKFLNGAAVNARTDDDKTLILAVRK